MNPHPARVLNNTVSSTILATYWSLTVAPSQRIESNSIISTTASHLAPMLPSRLTHWTERDWRPMSPQVEEHCDQGPTSQVSQSSVVHCLLVTGLAPLCAKHSSSSTCTHHTLNNSQQLSYAVDSFKYQGSLVDLYGNEGSNMFCLSCELSAESQIADHPGLNSISLHCLFTKPEQYYKLFISWSVAASQQFSTQLKETDKLNKHQK